jgi:hypothetical protein
VAAFNVYSTRVRASSPDRRAARASEHPLARGAAEQQFGTMLRVFFAMALVLGATAARPMYTPSPTFVSANSNAAALSAYGPAAGTVAAGRLGLKTDDGEDDSAYASLLVHPSAPS